MPKHILTPEDRQEILLKSDRYTAKQLAEQYGCSRSTILKLWMDSNYHKPIGFSYYVNDNYFSNINSANKAYIVGLIASDGNVYKIMQDLIIEGNIRGNDGHIAVKLNGKNFNATFLDSLTDNAGTIKLEEILKNLNITWTDESSYHIDERITLRSMGRNGL